MTSLHTISSTGTYEAHCKNLLHGIDEVRCSHRKRRRQQRTTGSFSSPGYVTFSILLSVVFTGFLMSKKAVWVNPFSINTIPSTKQHIVLSNIKRYSRFHRFCNIRLNDIQRNDRCLFKTIDFNGCIKRASSKALTRTASITPDSDNYIDNLSIEKQPRTRSILRSCQFFVHYVIYQFWKNRHERYKKRHQEYIEIFGENSTWKTRLAKLNEQRLNLVTLANYGFSIVAPSFLFLFIGALTTSIVPHYWAKCIQLVATVGTGGAAVSRHVMFQSVTSLYLISTAAALFTGLRGSLFWMAGSRANYNVRVKLHRNLLLQEAAFFDMNETGYLLSRLNNDVNKIGQVISYHVNVVFRQLAQCIFGTIYMIKISPLLSLYTLIGLGLVAIISAVYGDFNRELSQRVQDKFADATAVAETSLSMSETVRSFDAVSIESDKYEIAQSNALELEEVQSWGYGLHKFVSDTVQEGLQVFLLVLCWYAGCNLSIPGLKLTSFLFYANFVLESSNEVGDQWAKIQGAIGASSFVFDLIRRVPAVRDPSPVSTSEGGTIDVVGQQLESTSLNGTHDNTQLLKTPTSKNGIAHDQSAFVDTELMKCVATATHTKQNDEPNSLPINHEMMENPIISVQNITITYGSMDMPAVNGVSLDVYQGDKVAIVGRSGSGKSSMLRLMLRFYDPQSGSILLKGMDLKNMTRKEIASSVSIVEQQPSLFPMTLLENVLYGIPKDSIDATTGEPCYSEDFRNKAMFALAEAGLSVSSNKQSVAISSTDSKNETEDANGNLHLDTRVGEGGRSLSGGQSQRLAIARTLVRNPRVILLDEPTAALDNFSEKKVILAIQNALKSSGECMVMVTHRLNVIRQLSINRVIVMDQGSIVEQGDPEKLLKNRSSRYATLAREQGILSEEDEASAAVDMNFGHTNY